MSATKPTAFPDWATDHTIETTPGDPEAPNSIVEPSAEKIGEGWIWKEKPPFNFFNWLGRLTGDWIRWFERHGKEHVHDGGADPLSAPKVALDNHVAWSAGGHGSKLAVVTDLAGTHKINHTSPTATCIQEADTYIARGAVITDKVITDEVVGGLLGDQPVDIPKARGPIIPIAWAIVQTTATPAILSGSGFSGVTRDTTGTLDLTLSETRSGKPTAGVVVTSGEPGIFGSGAFSGTTNIRVITRDTSDAASEPGEFTVIVMGLEA